MVCSKQAMLFNVYEANRDSYGNNMSNCSDNDDADAISANNTNILMTTKTTIIMNQNYSVTCSQTYVYDMLTGIYKVIYVRGHANL